jgi:hypothetical protein
MTGCREAAAALALSLTALVAACELDERSTGHVAPGHETRPELCLETTACTPHGAPAGSAYLVDGLVFTAPDRLSTEFMRSHINEAIRSGELVLVLQFQPETELHERAMAAGPALDAGSCHVFEPPVSRSGALDIDETSFRARDIDVRLLMRTPAGETALDLLLGSSSVEGLFSPDGLHLVGGRGTGHGDMASIVSIISAQEARAVPMPLLGVTLCGLLSGSTGIIGDLDDDCSSDPETWPSPPSTTLGGEPAYRIEIAFEAACIPLALD